MTVTSGFFNSVNHDRLYDAEQVSSMFDGIIIDGVYENYGEALNVTAYSGANSTVIVGTGRAWFDHTWTLNDSQFSITLDPPNELLGRTDSIVIDIDKTQSVRKNSIIYVKGSESTPDLPPTLINTDLHKQYPICYINRPAGSNKPVTQKDITITVGTSVCPIVTGVLEAQNLENLMQQLDDEFNTWWDGIKDTLDENVVTNLQNQINELKDKIDGDDALVGLLEKPVAEAFMSGDYGVDVKTFSISNSSAKIHFYNPFGCILPDGKILAVFCDINNIYVTLTTLDGVKTTNTYSYLTDAKNLLEDGMGYRLNQFYTVLYANCNLDVYPINFDLVFIFNKDSQPIQATNFFTTGVFCVNYKVTSSGSVSHTVSGKYTHTNSQAPLQSYTFTSYSSYSKVLPSGSNIYVSQCSTSYGHTSPGTGFIDVAKLSSDGILSDIKTSSGSITLDVSGGLGVGEYEDNVVAGSIDSITTGIANHLVIDENDLTAQFMNTPTVSIQPYTSNYPAEVYSLSEKNGVQKSSVTIGSNKNYVDSKRSQYFCGASNLGGSLPEGVFIAKNIDSVLYGVGSSGENIAIGTNGGAAILKSKTPINTTIDKNKIVTELIGWKTVDNRTIYLLDNNAHSANPTFNVIVIG